MPSEEMTVRLLVPRSVNRRARYLGPQSVRLRARKSAYSLVQVMALDSVRESAELSVHMSQSALRKAYLLVSYSENMWGVASAPMTVRYLGPWWADSWE